MSKLSLKHSLKALSEDNALFRTLFTHGSLEIELYKPVGADHQKPHERDEIYVIASGNSHFTLENDAYDVVAGDVLFVAAGLEHRFSHFSSDFSTWVFFYGPKGGEVS